MRLLPQRRRSTFYNETIKQIFTYSKEQRVLADSLDGSHQVAFQRNLDVLPASQEHAVLMKEPKQEDGKRVHRNNQTKRNQEKAMNNEEEDSRRSHTKP